VKSKDISSSTGFARIRMIFFRPEIGVVIGLLITWAIFYILSPKFLWPANIGNIFTAAAELGIIAVGMAFLLISGEFDLSVGSVYIIAPTLMMRISDNFGIPLILGFLIGLVVSCAIGFFNGIITIKFNLPSFIVTLASMMLLSGIVLAVTGGFITEASSRTPFLYTILARRLGFFRLSTLWMFGIVILFSLILDHSKYGNWVYATGGNVVVATKMGVATHRVKIINFVICSLLAGFAGCVGASRVYSVNPAVGFDLMLNAIAAAIIGGCLITGGRGSIVGTFLGVMLLTSVNSGLILAGASPYWYRAFIGAIILVVVVINLAITRRIRK